MAGVKGRTAPRLGGEVRGVRGRTELVGPCSPEGGLVLTLSKMGRGPEGLCVEVRGLRGLFWSLSRDAADGLPFISSAKTATFHLVTLISFPHLRESLASLGPRAAFGFNAFSQETTFSHLDLANKGGSPTLRAISWARPVPRQVPGTDASLSPGPGPG